MMFKNTLLPSRIFCQRLLHNYSELKYLAINGNSYTVSLHVIIKFIGVHSVTGESQNPDGQVALLDYREDGVTPYMLFFKDGIKEEKYVRCSSTFRTDILLIILMCYRLILIPLSFDFNSPEQMVNVRLSAYILSVFQYTFSRSTGSIRTRSFAKEFEFIKCRANSFTK